MYLLRNVTLPNDSGTVDGRLGGSAGERILGTEISMRLKRLNDRGVRTIFVADSCHGGGMTREPLSAAPSRFDSERTIPNVFAFADGADPLQQEIARLPAPIDTDKELRALSFLAAVDPFSKAPEVEIPKGSGRMRGALSYAFARVIEGKANRAGEVNLTHGELLSYVKTSVSNSMLDSGKGQKPDLRPRDRDSFERVVLRFGSDLSTSFVAPEQVAGLVRVFSQDGKPVAAVKRPERGFAIQPVSSANDADITFNATTGDVYSKGGDLIAMHLRADEIANVAEREVVIRRLVELAKSRPRPMTIDRGERRYLAGDIMSLDARRTEGSVAGPEYYVLIVISGNGKVQFQYPRGKDSPILPTSGVLSQMQATEPFGADYAVMVVDDKPLKGLIKSLCQLDGSRDARLAVNMIERTLTPTMRIGLQGIYTAPKPGAAMASTTQEALCPTFRRD